MQGFTCARVQRASPHLLALLVASAAVATAAELADHLKVCSRSDPQLGQCIVDSLNGAREQLVKGIPEMGLPPLDPLAVARVDVEEGQEDVNLRFNMKNTVWTGIREFTATRAMVDFSKPYMEIQTQIPAITFSGQYTFGGRLLTLPINGKGDFEYTLSQLDVTNRIELREENRGGKTHWEVTRYRFDMEIGGAKILFKNLFRGNRRLGNFANDFLNRHWKAAYMVYRPIMIEAFGGPFQNMTNTLFQKFSLDELFSP